MYIITEIQTAENGAVGTIVTTKENRNEAESVYHGILAAAAISEVFCHAAVLMSEEGFPLRHECYRHGAPDPEPEEPEEPEEPSDESEA